MKRALLIIDVQRGLCEGDAKAFEVDLVVKRINELSHKARNAKVPVVFVQHEGKNGYLEFESEAWQLAQDLETSAEDIFVRKTTPDSFHKTDLTEILNLKGVTELVICGMHTEFCVDTTTRRALALGYPVLLVADAHTTLNSEHLSAIQIIDHHNATLTSIKSFGVQALCVPTLNLSFKR